MIIFAHLLNDRSGSPRILQQVISILSHREDGSRLFVSSEGSGFLDESAVAITRYWYWRTPYRFFTFLTYLTSQFCLMISLFRSRNIDANAVIYTNTLLPFGAAIYGWLTRRPVIYHLHEVSISPAPLRWFLVAIARATARQVIYVSNFHRSYLPIDGVQSHVVHNTLVGSFLMQAANSKFHHRREGRFNVLMLASLRDYKGIPELIKLAEQLVDRSDIHFHLVPNDDEDEVRRYFRSTKLPSNMSVHLKTDNPAMYYAQASLLLNLSRPDQCIETFGLTLLEAMAFGVPVIAPPIGGPLELVDDGCEGFLIDSRNGDKLVEAILKLADDEYRCLKYSEAARRRAACFSPVNFEKGIRMVLAFQYIEKFNK